MPEKEIVFLRPDMEAGPAFRCAPTSMDSCFEVCLRDDRGDAVEAHPEKRQEANTWGRLPAITGGSTAGYRR